MENFRSRTTLRRLNTEIEKKIKPLPKELANAEFLSAYSVATCYSGWDEPVTEAEYLKAIASADEAVHWVERQIGAQ